jgi:DNA modification methylase
MVNIDWKGKKRENNDVELEGNKPFHILDIYPSYDFDYNINKEWHNQLILGENKTVLNSLLNKFENKISLIYIDPPFYTGGDFNFKIQIGDHGEYINKIAYKDKWENGLDSYLSFLHQRLIKMKQLLKPSGSIYVHLDWHISHYIKLIMDEIFGIENFRNVIIWAYPAASVKTRRFFIRSYDTILFYSNSDDYTFNDDPAIYMEYSDRVKNALKEDDEGVFYYRGGSHNGKKLSRKVYVQQKGIFPRDVWNDIPYIRANTAEYQGFSTQKPERLLRRIILASTNEDDIVADFFCGSGTTLAVAEKLGRRWIGTDINKQAIHMSRKRILNIGNSNDILNWKEKYNRMYHSFKVLSISEEDKNDLQDFLKMENQTGNEELIQQSPEVNINLKQNQNSVLVELLDYNLPYLKVFSHKITDKITNFSDLIDYWALDYNYKDYFNNMWISYRSGKKRELKLKSNLYYYEQKGTYNLSVKLIDIFGTKTQKSYIINI